LTGTRLVDGVGVGREVERVVAVAALAEAADDNRAPIRAAEIDVRDARRRVDVHVMAIDRHAAVLVGERLDAGGILTRGARYPLEQRLRNEREHLVSAARQVDRRR
jgi:hypothetical protein